MGNSLLRLKDSMLRSPMEVPAGQDLQASGTPVHLSVGISRNVIGGPPCFGENGRAVRLRPFRLAQFLLFGEETCTNEWSF